MRMRWSAFFTADMMLAAFCLLAVFQRCALGGSHAPTVVADGHLQFSVLRSQGNLQPVRALNPLKSMQNGIFYKGLEQELMDRQVHQFRRRIDAHVQGVFQAESAAG